MNATRLSLAVTLLLLATGCAAAAPPGPPRAPSDATCIRVPVPDGRWVLTQPLGRFSQPAAGVDVVGGCLRALPVTGPGRSKVGRDGDTLVVEHDPMTRCLMVFTGRFRHVAGRGLVGQVDIVNRCGGGGRRPSRVEGQLVRVADR